MHVDLVEEDDGLVHHPAAVLERRLAADGQELGQLHRTGRHEGVGVVGVVDADGRR